MTGSRVSYVSLCSGNELKVSLLIAKLTKCGFLDAFIKFQITDLKLS
uniref:Uncharacterized protein n=1 Tax=Anguilla anguilla TaxID=7936 RepID=A0A0E9WDV2_ANGAN